MICRDVTLTDVEVMAQEGYNIVWFDLEHGPQATEDVIRMGRTVAHLGMVPLGAVPELSGPTSSACSTAGCRSSRSQTSGAQTRRRSSYGSASSRRVESAASPPPAAGPLHARGRPSEDPSGGKRRHAPDVMVETDEGYEALDDILAVDGVDIVTAGTMDCPLAWGCTEPRDSASCPKGRARADGGPRRWEAHIIQRLQREQVRASPSWASGYSSRAWTSR